MQTSTRKEWVCNKKHREILIAGGIVAAALIYFYGTKIKEKAAEHRRLEGIEWKIDSTFKANGMRLPEKTTSYLAGVADQYVLTASQMLVVSRLCDELGKKPLFAGRPTEKRIISTLDWNRKWLAGNISAREVRAEFNATIESDNDEYLKKRATLDETTKDIKRLERITLVIEAVKALPKADQEALSKAFPAAGHAK
jgi:hypothetical protein